MLSQSVVDAWLLTNVTEFKSTPYSVLHLAFSGTLDQEVVVKIANSRRDSQREAKALQILAGKGCVRLLDYLTREGAALIEHIVPGTPLSELFPQDDEKATIIMCKLMRKLPNSSTGLGHIQSLAQRLAILETSSKIIEDQRIRALSIAKALLKSARSPAFLHGDLHHDNILLNQDRGYIAIDPKGIIGELEYEVAAFMCNPIGRLRDCNDLFEILNRRVNLIAAEFGFSEYRVKLWTYVHATMACLWAEQDGLFGSEFFFLLDFLEKRSFITQGMGRP